MENEFTLMVNQKSNHIRMKRTHYHNTNTFEDSSPGLIVQLKNVLLKMKRLIILSFFISAFSFIHAQWSYPVVNFSRNDYKAGAQNWQIRQGPNGWIYVANSNGLLEYDGKTWNTYAIPNDNVRSIMMIPQKRIYVGGIDEFGYYESLQNGKMNYVSLSKTPDSKQGFFGNVWDIHQIDQNIYYRTDRMIVKQSNNTFAYIDTKIKLYCSAVCSGLLFGGTKNGLYMLLGDHLSPVPNAEILQGKRIRALVPVSASKMIIATSNDGLYMYENEKISRFTTEVDAFIKESELFSCAISPNYIAIGTIRDGVAIITHNGKAVIYSNMRNGLQDNTVLSLSFDMSENLWLGLNQGISFLRLNGALSSLYSQHNFYGVGYTAKLLKDKIYFGTNEGLFYSNWPIPVSHKTLNLNSIQGLNGQVWDLSIIQGTLFCAHDKGVFIVNGSKIAQGFDTGGAWACRESIDSTSVFLGCYSGMFILKKNGGKWGSLNRLKGYAESTRFFEQDHNGIWVSHDQKGIIRLQLNPDGVSIRSVKYYGLKEGMPVDKKVGIEKMNGKVIFITPFGIYRYNSKNDRMELDNRANGMNRFFGSTTKRLAQYKGKVWTLSENQIKIFSSGHVLEDNIKDGLDLKEGYEMLYPITDNSALISSERGFYQARFEGRNYPPEKLFLQIKKVILSKNDSLLYRASFNRIKVLPEIDYRHNSVKFIFGAVKFLLNSGVKYSFKLEGYDEWSALGGDLSSKEYTDLLEGKYTFRVKAVTSSGLIAYDDFSFRIKPPWYRSWLALIIYLVLLGYMVRFFMRFDRVRIQRRELQMQKHKQSELEAIEKEYKRLEIEREKEIMRLKSEQLESDLVYKSQELSNVMLSFVSKNEMLMDIKSDLYKISAMIPENEIQSSIKRRLFALSNKINSSMQHDEDWKKFEKNFDFVHNGFIHKLTECFPELTFSERRMCIYLKVDLASKEIASLLNISSRSVETVRYRLRKKFGLDREDNLRDFLNRL